MVKKKCQINARTPVTCFSVPIIGYAQLDLTYDEIYKCLCSNAEVVEILEDGSTVNLNFRNYNKNNSKGEPIEKVKATPVEEVVEEIVPEIEPHVEVTEEETTLEVTDKVEVEETVEEVVEPVEETPVESGEETIDDTVKDYTVDSRNNKSYKKVKNNRK